jgi:hypothetical protein
LNPYTKKLSGWREWALLSDLKKKPILTKLDTGAKTSALHGLVVNKFYERDQEWVSFWIYKTIAMQQVLRLCTAKLVDIRWVTDSGGHRELRHIIKTTVTLGAVSWPIEISLTNRDTMKCRLLLGRSALVNRIIIDPQRSFMLGTYKELL